MEVRTLMLLSADTYCEPTDALTLADVKALDRVYPGIADDDTALYRCRALYDQLAALQRVGMHSVYGGGDLITLTKENLSSLASAVEAWPTVFDAAAGRCRNMQNNV